MKWFVFLVLSATAAHAQLSWDARLIELHPSIYDTNAVARFTFKNVGKDVVTFSSVKSSCGCCTVAMNDKQTYKPGETGEVTGTFTIGNRLGVQQKTIAAASNDPKDPLVILTLRIHIPEMLKITPAVLNWNPGDGKASKTITIQVVGDEKVRVQSVSSADARVKLELKEVKAGREYRMIVTPSDVSKTFGSILYIKTDTPKEKPKGFSVYAQVRSS